MAKQYLGGDQIPTAESMMISKLWRSGDIPGFLYREVVVEGKLGIYWAWKEGKYHPRDPSNSETIAAHNSRILRNR